MFRAEPLKKKSNFYSIKEASFRLPSDKEDIEAVRRSYTNPKTGEDGVAYERAYKSLTGIITDVSFPTRTLDDGTVLRSMNIVLGEDDNGVRQVISLPVDSRFADDFLKRLPAIDLSQPVCLMPYDFVPKDGPRRVGISVTHQGPDGEYTQKVHNFFVEETMEGDKKVYKNRHGFPEPTDEDAEDWPFYFKKVNKFLVAYAQKNVCTNFVGATTQPGGVVPKPAGNDDPDAIDRAFDEAFKGKV